MSITVAIYERDLLAAGACSEGIALWRSIAEQSKRSKKGELRVKVTWTRLHLLWFATAHPAFFAWCCDKGITLLERRGPYRRAKYCFVCGDLAETFTGHVHIGDEEVILGWCARHERTLENTSSPSVGESDCAGCYGRIS